MKDVSPLVEEAEKRAQWWEERWARRPEGKEKDEAAERMDAWQTVAAELREESSGPGSPVAGGYAALAKRMESHAVEAEETMGESGSPNIKNRYKGLAQGYREAARMVRECAA
jgi:hypothetical protein